MTIGDGVKSSLQRHRLEVVVPRRRGAAYGRHVRVRRFRLPDAVEETRDAAGPGTVLVDRGRVMNRARFRYDDRSWHPLVEALREQLRPSPPPYEESVLARYFERFQPATVHDVLLGPDQPRRVVAGWPAVDELLDVWSATDGKVRDVEERLRRRGGRWPSQSFGPNDVPDGRDHLERTADIYRSMRDTGFRPADFDDGFLTGYFLVDGDDYRLVVGRGNHRMAALTALDVDQVPVLLRTTHPPVVARDQLRRWTIDGGGLFSAEEATALFDCFFRPDEVVRARRWGLA